MTSNWIKGTRRVDLIGSGSCGMIGLIDLAKDKKKYFATHTMHIADPDSMITAFNG